MSLRAGHEGSSAAALIAIRDHGPGVPAAELEYIFQPFVRLAQPHDVESKGAGLGLAIADRIVRLHRGSIRAENADGGGLSVQMSFPRA